MSDNVDYAEIYELTKNTPRDTAMPYVVIEGAHIKDIENDGFPTQHQPPKVRSERYEAMRKVGFFVFPTDSADFNEQRNHTKLLGNTIRKDIIDVVVPAAKAELLKNQAARKYKSVLSKKDARSVYRRFCEGVIIRAKYEPYGLVKTGENMANTPLAKLKRGDPDPIEGVFVDFLYKMNSDLKAYGEKQYNVAPRMVFPINMTAAFIEFFSLLNKYLNEYAETNVRMVKKVEPFGSHGSAHVHFDEKRYEELICSVNHLEITPAAIKHEYNDALKDAQRRLGSPAIITTGLAPLFYMRLDTKNNSNELFHIAPHPRMRPLIKLSENRDVAARASLLQRNEDKGEYMKMSDRAPLSFINRSWLAPTSDMNDLLISGLLSNSPHLSFLHYAANYLVRISNLYISSDPKRLVPSGILLGTGDKKQVTRKDLTEIINNSDLSNHDKTDAEFTVRLARILKQDGNKILIVNNTLSGAGLLPVSSLQVVLKAARDLTLNEEAGTLDFVEIDEHYQIVKKVDALYGFSSEANYSNKPVIDNGGFLRKSEREIKHYPDTRFPLFSITEQADDYMLSIQKTVPIRLGRLF